MNSYYPQYIPMYRSEPYDSFMYPMCSYCAMRGTCEKNKLIMSARNQLKGEVVEVTPGAVNSKVVIDIGCGNRITSIITIDSVKNLGIKVGSKVTAVIKSSDVMIGVDDL